MQPMIEILQYNYWEHFKAAKDLARVLPNDHPKIIAVEKSANELLDKINEIKNCNQCNQ
jgi:hypothetical protein